MSASIPKANLQVRLPYRILMLSCIALFTIFGVLSVQYGISLMTGSEQWANQILYLLANVDPNPEAGMTTAAQLLDHYRSTLGPIMTHTIVGGVVVSVGLLQFVPSFRRRYPTVHRQLGAAMLLAMLAVSVSAMLVLKSTPMDTAIAGKSFYIALWSLSIITLGLIAQSVLSLASKDFRGHMVWMVMLFASYLTAPWLRVNYSVVGMFESMTVNRLVQNSVGSSLTITLSLMALWLIYFGDRDLPYRGDKSAYSLPKQVSASLAGLSAIACLVGALLVAQGALSHLLLEAETLVYLLMLWAVAKVWMARESWVCWNRGMQGKQPQMAFAMSIGLGVLLTWSLAQFINTSTFQGHALYYGLIHYMVIEILLTSLAFATPALSTGRSLFTLCAASNVWVLGLLPLTMLGGLKSGLQLDESVYSALGRMVTITFLMGTCVATICRLRLIPSRAGKPSMVVKQTVKN